MSVTFKLCMPDKYCILNTNRKPWSNIQMATLLPVFDAARGRNRQTAIIDLSKAPITSEGYTVDKKHVLNTKRKPWSTNRLVASFPVYDVI
jgi:hypothetical protein